jgi:hypothetical protein
VNLRLYGRGNKKNSYVKGRTPFILSDVGRLLQAVLSVNVSLLISMNCGCGLCEFMSVQ